MQTKIGALCDKILEAAWLVAIVAVPVFFNIHSGRIFEPDKLTFLRSVAVLMVAVWLIRLIEQGGVTWPGSDGASQAGGLGALIKNTPLVLPTLLLVGVYLLATATSIVPRVSLWGSYQRLQGTYTTLSYIVIFAIMLQTLRSRAQIDRLVTTIILTSVPVSFYAILQHYDLDPLPWIGNVQARVAANMGNSIFLAAYLIMVAPLTWARAFDAFAALLLEEEGSTADIVRGAIYVFVAFLQGLAIYWTSSRGPLIGLFAGGLAFLLVLGFVRRWRWLVWGSLGLAVSISLVLVLLNVPGSPLEPLKANRYIGRMGQIFETDTGTGKVRVLIWEGAIDLILPHPALEFPDGPGDALNFARPLIGYGPESMWVAYNRFYPPDLAHVERRNASPDRSHNETFDALVITGLLGFVVYMLVFASVFYYGFKWLGLIRNDRQRKLFVAFWIAGGFLGAVVAALARQEFIGVGLPAGIVAGVGGYLALATAFAQKESESPPNRWYQLLLIAIISAVVAHFVEIHFGIAIAATRTYFWAYVALLVIIGHALTPRPARAEAATGSAAETRRVRRARRRKAKKTEALAPSAALTGPAWLGPVLVYSLLVSFLFVVLVYDFVTNQAQETVIGDIIWHSLTTTLEGGRLVPSYSVLWMFGMVWLVGGALVVAELAKGELFKGEGSFAWLKALLVYALPPLVVASFYANWHAYRVRQVLVKKGLTVIQGTNLMASIPVVFYLAAFFLLLMLGLALYWRDESPRPSRFGQGFSSLAHLLILGIAVLVIWLSNVNVIRADIIFKQAEPYERERIWQAAVQIYQHALEVAPHEDQYYLYLGRAYLELAKDPQLEAAQKLMVLDECRKALERALALNPLNTDHSANLARLYHTWAAVTPDADDQMAKLNQSLNYYQQATRLSPNNAQLLNEWAEVYMVAGQFEQAQEKLEASLALDQEFDMTYYTFGNLYQYNNQWQLAAEMYEKGLALNPNVTQRWGILSTIYVRLGRYDDAVSATLQILERRPDDFDALKNLALLYRDQGQFEQAIVYAQRAAETHPEQIAVYQLLGELYRAVRDLTSAEVAYRQALQMSPQDVNILWGLAMVYWDQARYSDAIEQLEAAQALAPDNVQIRQVLGDLYVRAGDWPRAIEAYQAVLDVQPDQVAVRSELARAYAEVGRLQEALTQTLLVLEAVPDDFASYRNLALLYQQLDRLDEALAAAEKALELAPESEREAIAELIAQLSQAQGP